MPAYDNHEDKIIGSLFCGWIGVLIVGIYALVIANANGGKFTGTLQSAQVITTSSCNKGSCSNKYYVGETYRKNNGTNTCLIQRLTPYAFRGDADNVALHEILGTQRQIWTTYYSSGTCYDQTIRNFWNTIGGCFFGFAMIPLVLFIGCVVVDFIKGELRSPRTPPLFGTFLQKPCVDNLGPPAV